MEKLSLIWFTAAGILLAVMATGLALLGAYQAASALIRMDGSVTASLLTGIGYVVIAIAVFDVAKYILEEEVVRERELRNVAEVRRSLTRFISIILIAVFLEAIVAIFKVSTDSIPLMLYPTLLLLAGVAMLVGLGAFQRLTATVERDVGSGDKADEHAQARSKPG